jgi:hypothetical protein
MPRILSSPGITSRTGMPGGQFPPSGRTVLRLFSLGAKGFPLSSPFALCAAFSLTARARLSRAFPRARLPPRAPAAHYPPQPGRLATGKRSWVNVPACTCAAPSIIVLRAMRVI